MEYGAYAVRFAIGLITSAAFLWVGMKAASFWAGIPGGGQYCGYVDLLKVALVSSLVSVVPYVGPPLSVIAMYYMLRRVTDAGSREIWIMVLISRVTSIAAVIWTAAVLPAAL